MPSSSQVLASLRSPTTNFRATAAYCSCSSSRPRVYCRATSHQQQLAQQQQQHASLELLRTWITANGGYIHPALQLVDNAPTSRCRGAITTQPISLEDLEAGPLVSVPQDLQFTSRCALELIRLHSNSHELVAVAQDQLTDSQLIAAALAYHSKQLLSFSSTIVLGSSSSSSSDFWRPYILSLPAQPPNPWLLQDSHKVSAALEPYATSRGSAAVAGWAEAVADYRQQMLTAASEVEQLLGDMLQITQSDIMAALGQVMSRSLTSGSSSSGLVPFVDLLNHVAGARAPMLQLDDNDKLVITVLPIHNVSLLRLSCMIFSEQRVPISGFLAGTVGPPMALQVEQYPLACSWYRKRRLQASCSAFWVGATSSQHPSIA